MELFDGAIYVAGEAGVGKLNGKRIKPLKVPGRRLRAKDGLLWAIGSDTVFFFDGKKWRESVCPDNVS